MIEYRDQGPGSRKRYVVEIDSEITLEQGWSVANGTVLNQDNNVVVYGGADVVIIQEVADGS